MTNKTRLNNHLKRMEIKARTELVQGELVELQTLTGNDLESYYMKTKNLDEDALTMFWKPKQAACNAQDGHDMIDAAIQGYKDVLESLTKGYNHVQTANDTFQESDWSNLQDKLNSVVAGIATISRFTEYNGQVLINGEYASSSKQDTATFLVGVNPQDTVTYTPKNMIPKVLGKLSLSEEVLSSDGITNVSEVYIDHFTKTGHEGIQIDVVSTDVAQIVLESITNAIEYVKNTLSDANLIQDDLILIKSFMESKALKGSKFLLQFKTNRSSELAQEMEDLESQLELLSKMEN